MHRIRILDAATRDLARLDKQIASRIAGRISWPAANFDIVRPEPMSGELSGLNKLRVGDYRMLIKSFMVS